MTWAFVTAAPETESVAVPRNVEANVAEAKEAFQAIAMATRKRGLKVLMKSPMMVTLC